MYQRPATKENDIPHRTKLHDEIMQKTEEVMDLMKNHFKVSGSWLCSVHFANIFSRRYLGKCQLP